MTLTCGLLGLKASPFDAGACAWMGGESLASSLEKFGNVTGSGV